ncbi:Peptide chain release factor 2 [Limosilactobacillus equigenerosi DSM 18793 = JCM 14505]|uniref:Peptide chain release factor 2 n=1 Tax=Limosilactobacillus equigenerosi DSM 18793 = JCM 14505 TaxID=1423742 RepID=A0A0R1UQ24_9LACO|nr:Peptide chain release factor 2 [Limosilactobacillus equigenerosi DSM 18793 = JCM 14505]
MPASGGRFDLDALNETIAEHEHQMAQPGFWDDNQAAQGVIDETNVLKQRRDNYLSLANGVAELADLHELLTLEDDADLLAELTQKLPQVQAAVEQYQLNQLLDGPYDDKNAILEIHPGAGGTEAQDWGEMLLRMYMRWADQHDFVVEVANYEAGEEAGVKSVTLIVKGHNAYGFLAPEKGVHRLVRISPFDSANRRHTSFASVDVMPELDDSIEVDINPADLRIDTFRSSGAGGQHINKTDSAIRITHLPTGIVTSSQAERSQLQNRETAMRMLKSKLYELEREKQAQERAEIAGEQLDNGWGSQIRSYVLHPYSLIKDNRTGYETHDTQGVLDGDLDDFINAYLKWRLSQKNPQ